LIGKAAHSAKGHILILHLCLLDGAACLQYCEDEDDNTVDFTDPGEYDNYAFKPKKQPSSEPIDPQVLRMKKLAGLDTPEEPKK
jgi:hypothetical protein